MINRAIIIVLDGFGVGELPDAHVYGDEGSNTLVGIYNSEHPNLPNTNAPPIACESRGKGSLQRHR